MGRSAPVRPLGALLIHLLGYGFPRIYLLGHTVNSPVL